MSNQRERDRRIAIAWALGLIASAILLVFVCSSLFAGSFRSFVPVTLTSDRTGLVMETGAKVKLRGVPVGRVGTITGGSDQASLNLEIDPDKLHFIPANVRAEIKATTAFGAKFVDLVEPPDPSAQHLTAGEVIRSRNVSTEVNTVFENLVGVLDQIDVSKLNATLSALAEGVRGQGERTGESITDANQILQQLNPRMSIVQADLRSFKGAADAYATAAPDILHALDALSTTSETLTSQAKDLDNVLMGAIGFGQSGADLLAPNVNELIDAITLARPTADTLMKYSPEYTCLLQGSVYFLKNMAYDAMGGNGRSLVVDAGLLLGKDPYRYPDNLPVIAAKGGPGGQPGCGSLPDATKMYPVRQVVTNTGWGTGMDIRPNPGIGFPGWANYFPSTRAVPEPPSIRYPGGPAPGPIPYPGAPPYGAPMYGADGEALYPPPPGTQPADGPPPAAPVAAQSAGPSAGPAPDTNSPKP
ncbi:MCE family protein [Mycolicibacterium sp. HS_4_1]